MPAEATTSHTDKQYSTTPPADNNALDFRQKDAENVIGQNIEEALPSNNPTSPPIIMPTICLPHDEPRECSDKQKEDFLEVIQETEKSRPERENDGYLWAWGAALIPEDITELDYGKEITDGIVMAFHAKICQSHPEARDRVLVIGAVDFNPVHTKMKLDLEAFEGKDPLSFPMWAFVLCEKRHWTLYTISPAIDAMHPSVSCNGGRLNRPEVATIRRILTEQWRKTHGNEMALPRIIGKRVECTCKSMSV